MGDRLTKEKNDPPTGSWEEESKKLREFFAKYGHVIPDPCPLCSTKNWEVTHMAWNPCPHARH